MSARHELLDLHLPLHDRQVVTLDANEDLVPRVICVDAAGHTTFIVAPPLQGDDLERALGLQAVGLAVREVKAVAAMLVQYSWFLGEALAAEALVTGVRPREHPKREEVCSVVAVDAGGVTFAQAPVVRGQDGQMLGVWERVEDGEYTSEAVDVLRAAVTS